MIARRTDGHREDRQGIIVRKATGRAAGRKVTGRRAVHRGSEMAVAREIVLIATVRRTDALKTVFRAAEMITVRSRTETAAVTTASREKREAGVLIKTIRKITRIIDKIPILLKVIEVAVDSIRIARKNLKAN